MLRRVFCKLLLVAVVVLWAFSGVLLAQGRSDQGLERAIEVQEKHTTQLMAIPGVVGTAIGIDQDSRAVVKVFTARGGVTGIPGILEDVRVQPVITGKFYALKPPAGKPDRPGKPPKEPEEPIDPTSRFDRPVPIGVSTGNKNECSAGTIACRVTDGTKVYALSNNHVYALENKALIDEVLQPGLYDTDCVYDKANVIGTLANYVEIHFPNDPTEPFEKWPTNIVDAAIAICCNETLGNATPSDGYGMPKSTTATARINQAVKKYGRTTGLTKGKIYAINATVEVGYESGVALFVDQIVITPGTFSAGGDSGSLVVVDGKGRDKADDRRPVGLLFAGSDLFTIANPIDDVLDALEVTIDGE